MKREIYRLNPRKVAALKERGYYADGSGLYLQVSTYGTKSWLFRFTLDGKAREMGLGAIHTVTLAEARQEAERCRKLVRSGVDPIEARKAEKLKALADVAKVLTFKNCAEAYIAAHEVGWRNAKHASQWRNTLATYAYPVIGSLPVAAVDTGLVLKCLEPIWTKKPETASRVRGRIESVLDWATARGHRSGDNPARWRGHLDNLLPARDKVRKVIHHPALAYADIPDFMATLREQSGTSARALEFTILTAARTSEAIGAKWSEIDTAAKVWTIPAERMKMKKAHKVPLSDRALEILAGVAREGNYVFPGGREGKPLSGMALLMTLRRMKRDDVTAHGFRSTFKDWASEITAFPNIVTEMALAHAVADKVEAAYRRGDLFVKRAKLMDAWAGYCASPARKSDVTPIRASGRATEARQGTV